MRGNAHLATVAFHRFENRPARLADTPFEGGELQRRAVLMQPVRLLQSAGKKESVLVVRLILRSAVELDAEPPRLDALAVRPGELQGDVGDRSLVAHVLRRAVDVLLRVAETVALQRPGRGGAGGGLVVFRFLVPDQHELDEVHQDGFPRSGHARDEEVAMDVEDVVVSEPVDRVEAREIDPAAHSLSSPASSGVPSANRSATRVHSSRS